MKDAVSVLRFHTYSVDEMVYRRNYDFFSSEQEIELDFHLEAKAILSDENK